MINFNFKHLLSPISLVLVYWSVAFAPPLYAQSEWDAYMAWKSQWRSFEQMPIFAKQQSTDTVPSQSAATTVSNQAIVNPQNWWGTVYQSNRDGNWEIYSYRGSQIQDTRLTTDPGSDTRPKLNKSGTQIVFVSDRDGNNEIYRMDSNGLYQTRLTTNTAIDTMPAWAPDSSQIVFVSERSGDPDIYLMQANGSGVRQILRNKGDDLYPTWSPDGKQIAWVNTTGKTGVLWVMGADGSGRRAVTKALAYLAHPVWSPDGQYIAFDYDQNRDGLSELATIRSDGSGLQTFLLSSRTGLQDHTVGSWSPDGNYLYMTTIQFLVENQQVVIDWIALQRLCLAQAINCSDAFDLRPVRMWPDVQALDLVAPISRVDPLPNYSRASGFLVNWQGQDSGPSGLRTYDIQYREENSTNWVEWIHGTTPDGSSPDPGSAGEASAAILLDLPVGKYQFRSRALDQAGNLEPWPANNIGDTTTTLFAWQIGGHVTDARGWGQAKLPIVFQPPALDSAVTNFDGEYFAHLGNSGSYQLNQTSSLTVDSDQTYNWYRLPITNLIQNGDFERGLFAWQVVPTTTPSVQVSSENIYAGQQTLHLGQVCPSPCLTPLLLSDMPELSNIQIFPDKLGNLHLFALKPPQSLYYRLRTVKGDWQRPVILSNESAGYEVKAASDADGNLYIIWNRSSSGRSESPFYYAKRSAKGIWSVPLQVGVGIQPKLAVGPNGNVHLLYLHCLTSFCAPLALFYTYLTLDGIWASPQQITEDYQINFAIAATDDSAYIVWTAIILGSEQILYASIQTNQLSSPQVIDITRPFFIGQGMPEHGDLALLVDQQNKLHLSWAVPGTSVLVYRTRLQSGFWSLPTIFHAYNLGGSLFGSSFMVLDHDNYLHLVGTRLGFQPPIYWHQESTQFWSKPQALTTVLDGDRFLTNFATHQHGRLYLTTQGFDQIGHLYQTTSTTQTAYSAIRQVVTVPADLHRPTLAFMYNLAGGNNDASRFTVEVSNSISSTQIFSATANTIWSLGWAGLESWSGQTITLTFTFHQAAGDTLAHVDLDEISLGAWETPVPRAITPQHIKAGIGATLVVSGENFIATPTIQLNDLALSNVRWLNEHQIEADLPETIGPGVYDLRVINPGGQMLVKPGALKIGEQTYLPQIMR